MPHSRQHGALQLKELWPNLRGMPCVAELAVSPTPSPYARVLTLRTLSSGLFGRRAFREGVRVKGGHVGGALIQQAGVLTQVRDGEVCAHTQERPHEDREETAVCSLSREASGETPLALTLTSNF